jgi:hypothetical protein
MPMMAINGKSRLSSTGFYAGTIVDVEMLKKVITSRAR